MNLNDRFEQATSGGPDHRPLEERLALGRRAQARRRVSVTVGAMAAFMVVGGVAWSLQPGPGPGGGQDVIASGGGGGSAGTSAPTPATPSTGSPTPAPPTVLFGYDLDSGKLEVADGVVIERQVDNPVPRAGVVSSAAVVTYKGVRKWVMAAVVPGRSGWSSDKEATGPRTFDQWVRDLTVLNTDTSGWVTLGADGKLTPHRGAAIVEQTSPAHIDQAPAGAPSANAMIEVDGARLCVVARTLEGQGPDISYLAESEYPGCGDSVPGFDYPGNPAS